MNEIIKRERLIALLTAYAARYDCERFRTFFDLFCQQLTVLGEGVLRTTPDGPAVMAAAAKNWLVNAGPFPAWVSAMGISKDLTII